MASESLLKTKSQYVAAIEELKAEKLRYSDLCDELEDDINEYEKAVWTKWAGIGFVVGYCIAVITLLII